MMVFLQIYKKIHPISNIFILSQNETPLMNLRSNEKVLYMKIDVLDDIHIMLP